ncbi:isoprenylcysteine carboxyl methyltransferase family protein [Thermoactinomyces mirandus]|uniref:15-methylpalmitoyl-4-hydroxy-2-pyrone 4-O-methyltransferase n=1 Tax=Thermoactinomyces mirandus TaxID=2756294 RepID=A0A7W2ATI5_9BACL|nr:isoprenylcysteine carboxylmethyltransferase family protein [Thermoactinomyces mirandus]MBA4603785.1 hypothetical protein [Thermoactinomyces mirandus]
MASWGLWLLWICVIGQRMIELSVAKRNARWIKGRGGVEYGQNHYPWLVLIHVLFLASILAEGLLRDNQPESWRWIPLLLFFAVQGLRIWVMRSLGNCWNTRIYVIPGTKPQNKGPYRYLRHPNYVVVILEFVLLPLVMGAFVSLFIFSTINLLFLWFVRIPAEEKAWQIYGEEMDEAMKKKRFLPVFYK